MGAGGMQITKISPFSIRFASHPLPLLTVPSSTFVAYLFVGAGEKTSVTANFM